MKGVQENSHVGLCEGGKTTNKFELLCVKAIGVHTQCNNRHRLLLCVTHRFAGLPSASKATARCSFQTRKKVSEIQN